MNEESWKILLHQIRDDSNLVVPIVGARLLVGPDGRSLFAPIAETLLKRYELSMEALPPFRELNEAVLRLKTADPTPKRFNLQNLYFEIDEELRALSGRGNAVTPEPIRQLAEITDFRLMVTLTADDLLARALRKTRALTEIIHSPNLPTVEGTDLPADWQKRAGEVFLMYLFGKSRSAPNCAIHDEDVLEYAHNVIAQGSHVPKAFLGELRDRSLLLIGCNFPDWLSRFMLRVTNKKRLSEEKPKREWMVEPLQPEESLTCFLRTYSRSTEILSDTSPAEFVAELHRRWTAERDSAAAPPQPSDQQVPPAPMFFVSYSRKTDLPRAEAMVGALRDLGLGANEIWFDRTTIEPGQDFRNRIFNGIKGCRFFLPLLSRMSNDRDEAFVFAEWRAANARRAMLQREFIIPIIVDSDYAPESYKAEPVPQWADLLHFGHAPDGNPNDQTRSWLKKLVRDTRARSASGGD